MVEEQSVSQQQAAANRVEKRMRAAEDVDRRGLAIYLLQGRSRARPKGS